MTVHKMLFHYCSLYKVLFVFTLLLLYPLTINAQMKAHFINVGQAESILLEFKTVAILIDAGGENTGDATDRDHLIGYLDDFFQRRTDLNLTIYSIIISHPHIDHTKHLMDILQRYKVKNLIDGGANRGSGIEPLRQARSYAASHNIVYNKILQSRMTTSGYAPSLIAALKNTNSEADIKFLAGSRDCEDENNNSLVLRVDYKESSFLFAGDSEDEDGTCNPQINNLLEFYSNTNMLDVDVYKISHHGSANGTTEELLEAISPEICVISAGHHSRRTPGVFHAWHFGHPRQSVIKILEEVTAGTRTPKTIYAMQGVRRKLPDREMAKAIYCTCWDGDVVISVNTDGNSLEVSTSSQ